MTRDEYLDLLRKEGLLKKGIQSGAINYVHVKHAEIRKKFLELKPNYGYVKAVYQLAHEYRLGERQIEVIIKK